MKRAPAEYLLVAGGPQLSEAQTKHSHGMILTINCPMHTRNQSWSPIALVFERGQGQLYIQERVVGPKALYHHFQASTLSQVMHSQAASMTPLHAHSSR
jgi:hypothetical protein